MFAEFHLDSQTDDPDSAPVAVHAPLNPVVSAVAAETADSRPENAPHGAFGGDAKTPAELSLVGGSNLTHLVPPLGLEPRLRRF